MLDTTVVIPTLGRPSLRTLLKALAEGVGPAVAEVVVVDDRQQGDDLSTDLEAWSSLNVRVVRTGGGGPAAARNLGWRLSRTTWVSFLDDDVVPDRDWRTGLGEDLRDVDTHTAGVQGRVRVPLPAFRRPTDWERTTAGLATARWITADLTYRRQALSAVGGFDERFPRAYREDADLGLRVTGQGSRITWGRRHVTHPVRSTDGWVSVRQQRGNADDVLMSRLHGHEWRDRAGAPRGARRSHLLTTACGAAALTATALGRPRAATMPAVGWAGSTARFALSRIGRGPLEVREVQRMTATSVAIPPAATLYWLVGCWQHRNARPWRGAPELVLLDRDGTLIEDVPYNGDPELVRPIPGALAALTALRERGVRVGVITNQSGVGRGLIDQAALDATNARVDELLGPFDVWEVCPHSPDVGCGCRKPAPGMVRHACQTLDVTADRCVVIGDIGSDVEAAETAGATGILVPTPVTRSTEVSSAAIVCTSLDEAVQRLLGGAW